MIASAQQETKLRSVLKGISWRIIASSATILVVAAISSFFGPIQWENAFKVAGAEFFLKLAIYYAHERVWQRYLGYEGHTPRMVLYKSIVWRVIATAITIVLSWIFVSRGGDIAPSLQPPNYAMATGVADFFIKFVLFYIHERLWHALPYGFFRRKIRTIKEK